MELHAGDMYLHPANVPHSSAFSGFNRFSNRTQTSWGKIYGRTLWHCDNCNHKLYEVKFELKDIEKDFLPHFKHFYNSIALRTCDLCGTIMEADPKFVSKD
jgi:3-hydroxyanthranilate 3,4-dioxygenase